MHRPCRRTATAVRARDASSDTLLWASTSPGRWVWVGSGSESRHSGSGLVWSGLDLWIVCSQDFDFMRDSLHELPVEQVARMCGLCIDFARVGGLVVGFR